MNEGMDEWRDHAGTGKYGVLELQQIVLPAYSVGKQQ
jgi:hypothetical protein